MINEHAIAAFFQQYASAFSACNVEAIVDLWVYPAYITADDRTAVYDSAESFRANTKKLCDFYATVGLNKASKQVVSVEELYPTIAMVRTRDKLYKSDGSMINKWEHVYLLRLTDSGWKAIVAVADGEMEAWRERGEVIGAN